MSRLMTDAARAGQPGTVIGNARGNMFARQQRLGMQGPAPVSEQAAPMRARQQPNQVAAAMGMGGGPAGFGFANQMGGWGYMPQGTSYPSAMLGQANIAAESRNYGTDVNAKTALELALIQNQGMLGQATIGADTQNYATTMGSRTPLQLSQMDNEAKWARMNRLAQMLNQGVQTDYGAGYS